jgi:integrative and conjugative element protein (TIGR02256 family)
MAPYETGGVLMGYFSQGESELVITDVIGPGPNAKHTTTAFSPDLEFQHAEIARCYQQSNRLHTYVADWHTHPDGPPALSNKDKRVLMKIARCADARLPKPAMVLLAGGFDHWNLGSFQLIPSRLPGCARLRPVRTKIIEQESIS